METNTQLHDKKKAFLEALTETLGNITLASQKIGIERKTVYNWKNKDVDFANAIDEIQQEYVVDYVESKMIKKINEGESSMIMFYLNNKAKHRGYGQQRQSQDDRRITINLVKPDDL